MSRERKVIVESPAKAPVYIITFSTLAALLLAFFVVLLSLGNVRDETLMDEGKGGGWSFLESFKAGFGANKFGVGSSYYYAVANPEDDANDRTVDASGERVRRTLKKLVSFGAVAPSPIAAERVNFALTDIHFSGDQITLDAQARRFLKDFCAGLLLDESPADVKLCVLCLSSGPDTSGQEKEMLLAAKRAKAVEDCLKGNLPAGGKWTTYSWGAGADSMWTAGENIVSAQEQVLIAILRNDRQTGSNL
jgi:hypothetical protein